jgi:hypothetical protein
MKTSKAEVLLATLILLLLLSPVVAELGANKGFLGIVSIPVIVSAALYASVSTLQSAIAIIIAAAWIWLSFFIPGMADTALPSVLYGLLLGFVTFTIFGHMFRAEKVDRGLVASAITVYLLLGVIWGAAYLTIYIINPGTFEAPGVDPDYASVHFLYYSYVTLTTLGYGDITPVSPTARILSVTEAITGVLYTAILIARLVSLYGHDLNRH